MDSKKIFSRPDFLPEFKQWEKFGDALIGITGHEGVLGGIIHNRFLKAGIKIQAYPGDILDIENLTDWFKQKQFSHFLHFAALVPVCEVEKDPLKAFEVNAIGTLNICKQIITTQENCWTFIASTSHIYKPSDASIQTKLTENSKVEPLGIYGKSKYVGDLTAHYLLENANIPYCIGRIFSFTHSSQQEPYLVPVLINKIKTLKDGETLHLTNPDSIRDIMDAKNVIDAILCLAAKKCNGVINIGCGKEFSTKQIAEFLIKKLNRHLLITGENKSAPNSLVADVTQLRKIIESKQE